MTALISFEKRRGTRNVRVFIHPCAIRDESSSDAIPINLSLSLFFSSAVYHSRNCTHRDYKSSIALLVKACLIRVALANYVKQRYLAQRTGISRSALPLRIHPGIRECVLTSIRGLKSALRDEREDGRGAFTRTQRAETRVSPPPKYDDCASLSYGWTIYSREYQSRFSLIIR